MLYGISQKEFYNKGPFGRFKRLENSGELSERLAPLMDALCRSLVETGGRLTTNRETAR
ncbi:MAG: XcyI family restriction endonuclease [Planctomycetes bacterium]|nr:XcyI family restriction endonuclease [Planctomycetota bacterium]MBL7037626.1 XcyI family restriction endonuclease [Pirellulaceae bacterium]